MRLGMRIAVVVALCLAFAGTAHAWNIKYANGPDPAVAQWPSWPDQVGCFGVAFDPVATFSGPTEAELGSGAPEEALKRYLDEGIYSQLPTKYWRQIAATGDRVIFASGRLELGLFWLEFGLVDGQWKPVADPADCNPRTMRADGSVATEWGLGGLHGLTPESRRIKVKLHSGGGCDGGRSENPIAKPEFRSVGRKLVLTVWVPPLPPGPQTCQARIEPPLTVKLPGGRLGKRQIWDGGTYPPKRER